MLYNKVMVPGPSAQRRPAAAAYRVLVVVYLAGLVGWLVLGLVPLVGHSDMSADLPATVAVAYLFSVLNLALGVLLMVKRPDDLVPRLLALAFMGTAATFNAPSHAVFHVLGEPPVIKSFHFAFHVVSGSAYLLAVVLFPHGSLPLGWGSSLRVRRAFAGGLTAAVVTVCWRSSFISHPPFFVVFFGVLIPVVGIAAQSLHLRQSRDVRGAEQSRLLRVALLPALAVALTWAVGHGLAAVGWNGGLGLRVATVVEEFFPAVFAVVPVMLFVAIVRHQLWDIDLVVSRALLIACLLTVVSGVYVGVVALTGLLVRGQGWAALVPLVIVACVAEPVRERCRAVCNRLVFGQRMSPREAIRSLVDRFAGIGDVDELTELTRVVVASTRANRAEIWLLTPGGLVLLAREPGDPSARTHVALPALSLQACAEALAPAPVWPVRYEGDLLAMLSVSTPAGTSLTAKETRLLADLSHHAGLLVRNAQLTVDLQQELEVVSARAEELERSRQAVVVAQDRQRRRLERDIHDGAQQQLVALLVMLRGRLRRLQVDGGSATRVDDLRSVLEESRDTLSLLARGGAPAVLVEAGLAAALEEAAAGARRAGPAVEVRVAGVWRGSVEADAAVYFCCVEAMLNAVKYAAATQVLICLTCHEERLEFVVSDDGSGFDPGVAQAGSGLGNLLARVLPFGGEVTVESSPGSGTTVKGWLPAASAGRHPQPVGASIGMSTP